MESIIDILHKGGYSCVMKNREEVRTFTQRGVADLYDLYQADSAFMKGAAIADKVIGKGAAALMVLGGFKTVYADIISTPVNPEKPDVPLNKNDAFQKVQKRRVQEKR